jgi:hypothetical protein
LEHGMIVWVFTYHQQGDELGFRVLVTKIPLARFSRWFEIEKSNGLILNWAELHRLPPYNNFHSTVTEHWPQHHTRLGEETVAVNSSFGQAVQLLITATHNMQDGKGRISVISLTNANQWTIQKLGSIDNPANFNSMRSFHRLLRLDNEEIKKEFRRAWKTHVPDEVLES